MSKEEMKERCLSKGQYIDKNAKAKFDMLCHLEDFEVQYWELKEENKRLKNNWNELQDVVICALRYAIGRKTYVTSEVCEFIMKHPNLINGRVKTVMLRDLENLDELYKKDDIDYAPFNTLREWLNSIDVDTEVEQWII